MLSCLNWTARLRYGAEARQPAAVEEQAETVDSETEETYDCPECGQPITTSMTACPNCGVGLSFEIEDEETGE